MNEDQTVGGRRYASGRGVTGVGIRKVSRQYSQRRPGGREDMAFQAAQMASKMLFMVAAMAA
jgi:hypothetical protein